ncbi:MAG: hypothetical protein AB1782_04310 [Cyanobacteriota bacterium]
MLKNAISNIAQYAMKKPTMFLLWSTIVGYGISSVGEAVGIYFNKKIDKQERTYMAIQDVLEGVLKLGTFFTLALGLQKAGRGLVESGKIITKNPSPMLAEGMATLGLIVGNILSFNLITPIVRNPLASLLQKKLFKTKLPDLEPYRISVPSAPLGQKLDVTSTNPFAPFEKRMQMTKVNKPVSPHFGATRLTI